RSFAEILRDNADLAAERRSEFSSILVEESKKLTNELRGLFDSLSQGRFGPSLETELPGEEVSEALYQGNNYFREIEEWAEDFRDDVLSASTADKLPDSEALACHLRRTFPEMGNLEASSSQKGSKTPPGFGTDPTSSCAKVPESSQRFKLLRRVAELYRTDGFDRLVREGDVSAGPAEDLYRRALTSYFAAAVMMPYEVFRQMARTWRHDLDALQAEFGASYEQVCHRLTTLQRPGSQGVPFHYLRSDIAGNIDKKFSASGLALPRFGGVCPLWNLHSSFMQRGQISMQLAVFPDNRRFIMLARSVQKPKAHYWDPEKLVSIVIGCDASFAHQLVYADGLDRNAAPAVPVGVSCKQCARHGCRHRAYPMHFAEKPAV
ncbi:MAG: short-chain fatty acyl-CoA regulator family protein, partial [Kiloniellales bacterium]|nr:short-chain fatty acyl-CoA regulator family protein [Kiloniellales bacterium]